MKRAEPETLGDALPLEIDRCQQLLEAYKAIGPVGQFGYMMIQRAQKAMTAGDCVQMLRSYHKLKEAK